MLKIPVLQLKRVREAKWLTQIMEILRKTEVQLWKSHLDLQKWLHSATYSYHQDSVEERFTEL